MALVEEDTLRIEFGTLAEPTCEAHFDTRIKDDDYQFQDRIPFPQNKLYGRDAALETLKKSFRSFFQQQEQQLGEEKRDEQIKCHDVSQVIFLAGCSGTGKSALVKEFVRQIQEDPNTADDFFLVSGKYEDFKTSNPFSAISIAFGKFFTELLRGNSNALRLVRSRLEHAGFQKESQDVNILTTLVPEISLLLHDGDDGTIDSNESVLLSSSAIHNINAIQNAFRNLFKAISTKKSPMIVFLDDLQWADEASLKLISLLLSSGESAIGNLLFIGAYRSNEVSEDHPFHKRMVEIENGRKSSSTAYKLEVFNLSPKDIRNFIADSIDRTVEEVGILTEVVYSKTLGNIFFVKQVLEELLRRNVLFFDMMSFQWQWGDLSQVELEEILPNDVVEMVKSKLRSLPHNLQEILSIAAFTGDKISLETLLFFKEKIKIDYRSLSKLMEIAVFEGVMLYSEKTRDYYFAHDRIREAAFLAIEPGEIQNDLRVTIANVFMDQASSSKDDWMLFVAVNHLNIVPATLVNSDKLSQLNLRVAKLAISKAAFSEAVQLLRTAWEILEKDNDCWKGEKYKVCLDVLTVLTNTEHGLGNFENALAAANEVIENARSLRDKYTAYRLTINIVQEKGGDYVLSLEKTVKILNSCGIKIKLKTTTRDLLIEKALLKIALRNRPLDYLTKLPTSTDDLFSFLMTTAFRIAHLAKNDNVADVIIMRMIMAALEKGRISESLGGMYFLAMQPRKSAQYKSVHKYIRCGEEILDRFSSKALISEHSEWIKLGFNAGLAPLSLSYECVMGKFFESQKNLMTVGATEMSLASMMLASFCFFITSLPLNSLFESRLLLAETTAITMQRQGFVVIFQFHRQYLNNLQGKQGHSSNRGPTHLKGNAFDEDKVLGAMEGGAKKMTMRDVSILRLQLALIFDDAAVMDEMLQRLDSYPEYDSPMPRQHLRMTYAGIAALTLAREKKNGKHLRWGHAALKHFKKLFEGGSPNARPVYLCLKAVNKPKRSTFDEAIDACLGDGLLNLAAIMNERCSYFLMGGTTVRGGIQEEYLAQAMWHYESWGAMAKVSSLKKQNEFLRNLKRRLPRSSDALIKANDVIKASMKPSVKPSVRQRKVLS